MDHDIAALASKRKPKKFRARETAARKAEALNKRRAEIEAHIAERNRELGGLREHLTAQEARAIQQVIERHERELREIRRLMTEIPTPSVHAGRVPARHRS
jgi:transcription elongation GreA/GreB family factor